jgi:hypothetical protein
VSLAEALMVIFAGAAKDAPFDGLVIDAAGGLFVGAGVPAVVKRHTGPSAGTCAMVFDTIFQ